MQTFKSAGLKVFLAGFVLILIGVVLMLVSSSVIGENVRPGVIIFVGPIPIMIGSGPHASFAIIIAAVLTIFCSVVFFFMKRIAKTP